MDTGIGGHKLMNLGKIVDLKLKDINYKVHVLPANTDVYRGDTPAYQATLEGTGTSGTPTKNSTPEKDAELGKDNNFFTLFPTEAEIYGVALRFTTQSDLNLIDINDTDNRKLLAAIPSINKILGLSYEVDKRDSIAENDDKFAAQLCDMGFDGYFAEPVESKGVRPPLPSELVICGKNSVEYKDVHTNDQKTITKLVDKHDSRMAGVIKKPVERSSPPSKKRRDTPNDKKRFSVSPIKMSSMGSMFGDDSDSDSDEKKGGRRGKSKRRTIKKKRNKRKSKRRRTIRRVRK